MVLKYHISPYPALLENMVVRIYEAQSPAAVVWEQELPAPHNVPVTIIANGLDKVVHIVRLYTKDTVALLHDYEVEPLTDLVEVFDPIRFRIGDGQPLTPIAGTSSYVNPIMLGLTENDYTIYRRGVGFLNHEQGEFTNNVVDGGFALPNPDIFNPGEDFIIQRKSKVVSTVVNDSVVGKWFGGFVDVDGELYYDPAHLRKMIRFKNISTYVFDVTDAIPIGYVFCFNHYHPYIGLVGSGTVEFRNAPVRYGNTFLPALTIKQQQEMAVVFDGQYWNVVYLVDSKYYDAINTTPYLGVVAAGDYVIPAGVAAEGNLVAGNPVFIVQHNLNIPGDYMVLWSVRSRTDATLTANNKIVGCWQHHPTDKANAFKLCLHELAPETQNIAISWIIIKL